MDMQTALEEARKIWEAMTGKDKRGEEEEAE